ncbi:uncharacterized protein LOC108141591 [Drosophila elegans]|uniref:uncharacterized protein LOC108141591 n=1 Tax=Drosophila elegans TaxID=30023 RepID=UPI0007E7E503|nr:uncharacterized protein LOC108141591 [Drosophila elegans]
MPSRQITKPVHSFLEVASWYKRFVPYFTELAQQLYTLVKKGSNFKRNKETEEAAKNLKNGITEAPVPACPGFEKTFVLQTGRSKQQHSSAISQRRHHSAEAVYTSDIEKGFSETLFCVIIVEEPWTLQAIPPQETGSSSTRANKRQIDSNLV